MTKRPKPTKSMQISYSEGKKKVPVNNDKEAQCHKRACDAFEAREIVEAEKDVFDE